MDSRALRDLRGESEFPPASSPGDDALIGTLVAERYRVVKKLGEGAQASVYVAKHTLIKRLVALKVLTPSIAADRDLVRRFLDEGQVAGTMGHPNIVESLDMGVMDDGRPFLVLEYLEGTTVADELHRRGALDVGRAAYIGMQVASALGAAHARGIVHRDMKPENVFLIDRDGRGDHVKVLDFGISKLESRKEGSARAALVVGTPDYMAPEQVTDPAGVDARADVFALGAMLYEMLSGRLPLDAGEHEDVLEVVVRRTPAPLGRICPHLPPQILATVERAMHKDRSKRTQTIGEVRAALELFAVASVPSIGPLSGDRSSMTGMARPSGVQSLGDAPDSARRSAPPSSRSLAAPLPSGSLKALATTAETAVVNEPASDLYIPVAATSAPSLLSSGAATSVAADADRLSAQLAAIAAAGPAPRHRSAAIPLLAGAVGACAAGVIVFLALRPTAVRPSLASAPARIEATPTAPARVESAAAATATGGGVSAAVTSTSQPGTIAAGPSSDAKASPFTITPPRNARERAGRDVAGPAALSAADARREREKTDALTNAAAEVSARSTAATSLAAAPLPPQPEPVAAPAAAPAAPTKATILPFGEGMTRPSAISPDEIQFTREAREARVSGTMIVRCLITTDGSLQNCRIMKSVPMMDQAVLSSLAQHRGAPVMYQGHPVSVEYTYTIRLKSPD
ncbi:MAG TPA: TonB family protein [Labilithrix sp.]|nr:TonB family protein [Labilithrix sp.]